ncbi:hypothetical protein [Microbacterium oxydans]|uniref:hypothetical protein n=1 Tax=Microbacterium oxydans TaxID=82380 RepID=UPI00142D9E67|nr:hypothetical protein [Microbacterium oxydans]
MMDLLRQYLLTSSRKSIFVDAAGYAEALGIPLLTLDRTLAKTAARYCEVIVL